MAKSFNELTFTDFVDICKKLDKKTWIKIAVGITLTTLVVTFIVWPAWVKRSKVRSDIKNFASQVSTLVTLQNQEPELIRRKEESLRFIYGAKERLFKKGEVSLLLGQIAKLADESGVVIISSRPMPYDGEFPVPFNSQYEASQYDFSVEGNYHQIGNFISKIEAYPKLLRVELFAVVPANEESQTLVGSISLTAVSFKGASS